MKKLRRLWRRLLVLTGQRVAPYTYKHVQDFPDRWDAQTVYLLGKPDREWLAGMLCPCGCNQPIELVLLASEWPRWKLALHKDASVSLKPSVWRTKGCKSHFFLTKGKIRWCYEE